MPAVKLLTWKGKDVGGPAADLQQALWALLRQDLTRDQGLTLVDFSAQL